MSDDAQIRRDNLKAQGIGPAGLVEKLGRTPGYWSALINGPKSFGEKIARSIEEGLALPRGWLDQVHGTASAVQAPSTAQGIGSVGPAPTLAATLSHLGEVLAAVEPRTRDTVAQLLLRYAQDPADGARIAQAIELLLGDVEALPTPAPAYRSPAQARQALPPGVHQLDPNKPRADGTVSDYETMIPSTVPHRRTADAPSSDRRETMIPSTLPRRRATDSGGGSQS